MRKSKIAYIMCGVIGVGKTHIAKTMFPNIKRVTPDTFTRGEWTMEKGIRASNKLHKILYEWIKKGEDFVVDSAAARHIGRMKLTKFIRDYSKNSYHIVCVYVKAPLKDCLKRHRKGNLKRRSEESIRNYHRLISRNPPSKKDGYDDIIVIDNSMKKDEAEKPFVPNETWTEMVENQKIIYGVPREQIKAKLISRFEEGD